MEINLRTAQSYKRNIHIPYDYSDTKGFLQLLFGVREKPPNKLQKTMITCLNANINFRELQRLIHETADGPQENRSPLVRSVASETIETEIGI